VLVTREVLVPERLSDTIDELQSIHLSPELQKFALEPMPTGRWAQACQSLREIADAPTAAELRDEDQSLRRWLQGTVFVKPSVIPGTDRVHFQSRGETVFRAICQNCHGKEADSKSPLAATILEITGGRTRVANFVEGLFGPSTAPGAFARDEFLIDGGATPDDWAARYLLFMGLGGTAADIPQIVLDLVATSPFYGGAVTSPGATSANMLSSAEQLCYYVLAHDRRLVQRGPINLLPSVRLNDSQAIFAPGSAHYELWESLCTFENEPVVRVFPPTFSKLYEGGVLTPSVPYVAYRAKDDSGAWVYPVDRPVGNQNGDVEIGIEPGNTLPWCVLARTEEEKAVALKWGDNAFAPEGSLPWCPEALTKEVLGRQIYRLALNNQSRDADLTIPLGNQAFVRRWLRHGAMNAGLSAYYYLRGKLSGELEPSLPFDFCKQ
jgi:hypothetical protein